jgi:D-alanyl-lipoteichoic acid acyltransferase DltB (MBOAT superfamily)
MDATSVRFFFFAGVAALLYNARRTVSWRQAVLMAANAAFLASFSRGWKAYVPLALFVGVGYAAIRLMQLKRWRVLFIPVVATFVFLFTSLKRYTFLPQHAFLPFPYLAIGVSYIFFRIMHMIVDARDETLPGPVGIASYLNYTLNFTTLVSGPIQLYPDFASSQLSPNQRSLTLGDCALGLERVVIGFFKLRILSAFFSAVQQAAIMQLSAGQPLQSKVATACVVVASYPIYLYFNFSGFIDVMLGLGTLFHLDLPENFRRPFCATSFIELWGRWHITLSNWVKTYVYTPLVKALMQKFPSPQAEPLLGVVGFFVAFFIVGVWHGPTSEFVFYGLLLGGGVALNKLFQIMLSKALGRKRHKAVDKNSIYVALSRGLTFAYFTFALIWFWSNWTQIRQLESALTFSQEISLWAIVWLVSTVLLAAWEEIRERALRLQWNGTAALLSTPVRAAWAVYLILVSGIALYTVNVSTPVLYQIF